MSKDKKQRYLYIDGQAVPVTEEVYRAYWHYTAKEDYFTRQLKTERFLADQDTQTAAFTPSREDSYERLLEQDEQFACESKPVEEQAVSSLWMEELFSTLSEEEQQIIYQRQMLERYARERGYNNTRFYIDDGVSGTTFQRSGFQQMISDIQSGQARHCKGYVAVWAGLPSGGDVHRGSFPGERHPFHCGERWRGQRKGGK